MSKTKFKNNIKIEYICRHFFFFFKALIFHFAEPLRDLHEISGFHAHGLSNTALRCQLKSIFY